MFCDKKCLIPKHCCGNGEKHGNNDCKKNNDCMVKPTVCQVGGRLVNGPGNLEQSMWPMVDGVPEHRKNSEKYKNRIFNEIFKKLLRK